MLPEKDSMKNFATLDHVFVQHSSFCKIFYAYINYTNYYDTTKVLDH